jgi:hypothetical protein
MKKKNDIEKELKHLKKLNTFGIVNYSNEIKTLEWVLQ